MELDMRHFAVKTRILLTLIPVLLTMGMIFFFSGQTGEQSGQMSGSVTRWILEHTVHDFQLMSAEQQAQISSTVGLMIRKLAHFSEFSFLGFFLMLHIRQIRMRIAIRRPWLWAWTIGTLYAATDELHQMFVGGRGPAVTDVLIDSCGVVFGIVFLLLICRGRKRKH